MYKHYQNIDNVRHAMTNCFLTMNTKSMSTITSTCNVGINEGLFIFSKSSLQNTKITERVGRGGAIFQMLRTPYFLEMYLIVKLQNFNLTFHATINIE